VSPISILHQLIDFHQFQYERYAIVVSYYDGSEGIGTGYGLKGREIRVRFPVGAGDLSLLHSVQNRSEVHPTSYPMCTGDSFSGGKATGL
jgi:hypothetical protein